jgi:uncharacterized protein (TIGR04255 family)
MERRKYRNPPIEEAVCDIQFVPTTEWDPTLPGLLFEKLRGTYNEKPRLKHFVESQVQGGSAEGGSPPSVQHRLGKQRVQLLAEKGTRIVGVGADQLSIHMLRPYTGWDTFRPRILQALAAYRQIISPEGIARIGLRYINRITINSGDPDLKNFFEIPPRFPETATPTRILGFFNRKESEFLDKPIRIVVTFADMEPRLPDSSSYLLDIDIIWISADDPIPLDGIETPLDDMKSRHREVFESLITEATRALFNGD